MHSRFGFCLCSYQGTPSGVTERAKLKSPLGAVDARQFDRLFAAITIKRPYQRQTRIVASDNLALLRLKPSPCKT
jgi:hypothetical protein